MIFGTNTLIVYIWLIKNLVSRPHCKCLDRMASQLQTATKNGASAFYSLL